MLDALYRILALPLTWFYDLTGNYVVAMILYAVLIKIVLFPFGIKQQKNMIKQATLRPKEMAIRKRYAGRTDKKTQMKMQEDLQKLYQSENYNPMSGCGPMLIQLPVIWVLYRIVYGPLMYIVKMSGELCAKLAEVAGEVAGGKFDAKYQLQWINQIRDNFDSFKDVATESGEKFSDFFPSLDSFNEFFNAFKIFGVDVSGKPWDSLTSITDGGITVFAVGMVLIPVLVFASQYLSMKIVRKLSYQPVQDAQTASSMKIMDIVMPLMTMYMAFILPGMLGIYWIVNSLLAIVQQVVLKKMYPIPQFTEEDYKAAERALKGSSKSQKQQKKEKVINPRSLHHIDDDDDEDTAAVRDEDEEESEGDDFE